MVRTSQKPVTSKISIMVSLTFFTTILPCELIVFWADSRIRRPADEMYSRSLKSKTRSFTPSSDSLRTLSSSGAVTVSRRPSSMNSAFSPLMFFVMFNDYSSGLNFYYFVSLFFSAAIMFVLRKTTNDAKLLAKLEAKYEENKKNPQKKLGGLAGRLQAMQEEQQRLQKQREELAQKRKNLGK